MAQTHILKGWRYGFTNGVVVANDLFNEATGNKDILEFYTGSTNYDNKSESFTKNIEDARFYTDARAAESMCRVVDFVRDVFGYCYKAHIEYY